MIPRIQPRNVVPGRSDRNSPRLAKTAAKTSWVTSATSCSAIPHCRHQWWTSGEYSPTSRSQASGSRAMACRSRDKDVESERLKFGISAGRIRSIPAMSRNPHSGRGAV